MPSAHYTGFLLSFSFQSTVMRLMMTYKLCNFNGTWVWCNTLNPLQVLYNRFQYLMLNWTPDKWMLECEYRSCIFFFTNTSFHIIFNEYSFYNYKKWRNDFILWDLLYMYLFIMIWNVLVCRMRYNILYFDWTPE